jgi:hypothetical protein
MVHGEKMYTKSNNMRAPSMGDYLQWVVDAWEQLPNGLILKSFKGCGLTNALDGSEDSKIHCFKSDGSIPTGCGDLQQARSKIELTKRIQQLEVEEGDEEAYNSDASITSMA